MTRSATLRLVEILIWKTKRIVIASVIREDSPRSATPKAALPRIAQHQLFASHRRLVNLTITSMRNCQIAITLHPMAITLARSTKCGHKSPIPASKPTPPRHGTANRRSSTAPLTGCAVYKPRAALQWPNFGCRQSQLRTSALCGRICGKAARRQSKSLKRRREPGGVTTRHGCG